VKWITLILTLLFSVNVMTAYLPTAAAKTEAEKAAEKEEKKQKKMEKRLSKKYKQDNVLKVLSWAKNGDIQAQCIIAYAYSTGQVLKGNKEEALVWQSKVMKVNPELVKNFRPLSKKDKVALSLLYGLAAVRSHNGEYVPQSYEDALRWAELGASENDGRSLAYMGSAFYTGRGVAQNYETAISYFKKAGENPIALSLLSDAYATGKGVEQSAEKSKFYADYLSLVVKPKLDKEEEKALKKMRKIAEAGVKDGIVR